MQSTEVQLIKEQIQKRKQGQRDVAGASELDGKQRAGKMALAYPVMKLVMQQSILVVLVVEQSGT
jgi:hypothetical protein